MDTMKKEENTRMWTLGQVSKEFGVSIYTLRKICDKGLIRGVRRKRNGYRILTDEQVDRLMTFMRLVECGIAWRDLKTFARMEQEGNRTANERKAILSTQKRQLWQELEDIQSRIDFIERKEELLDQIIRGGVSEKPEQSV